MTAYNLVVDASNNQQKIIIILYYIRKPILIVRLGKYDFDDIHRTVLHGHITFIIMLF